MEIIIKSKEDVRKILNKIKKNSIMYVGNGNNCAMQGFCSGGKYYKQGYRNYIYIGYNPDMKSYMYNYRRGTSELLNNVKITQDEAIDYIWDSRKYINYCTHENLKEQNRYS